MLFITLILTAGFTEGGNYPMAVVMLILLGIQVKGVQHGRAERIFKSRITWLDKIFDVKGERRYGKKANRQRKSRTVA